jgi:predicted nicotinamide N-methyase
LEDFGKNKNNKVNIPKNHLNDQHHLAHKNKIWQKSSTPPMLFSNLFWNLAWLGKLVLARFLGIINLNRRQIIIVTAQLNLNWSWCLT